jgi:hypothetical protein
MGKNRKLMFILAGAVMGLLFYSSAAWAQGHSPEQTAKDFAKAYFMLDSSMEAYLSEEARMDENGIDLVELYLDAKAFDAQERGYKTSYLQMHPILLKTRVVDMDDESATIAIDGLALRSINPLFRIVGFVFGLLEEHELKGTIPLVKQDGEWKIGPGALDMPI